MARKKPIGRVIVSYRELANASRGFGAPRPPGAFELESAVPRTPESAEALALVSHAMRQLEEAEARGGVMVTVQDRAASLLQSHLARQAANAGKLDPAKAGALEAKFDERDLAGWIGSFFSWWKRIRPHKLIPAAENPDALPNKMRVALFADWATGLYGAPRIQRAIEDDPTGYQLVMHLGDVYYSGDDDEVRERLLEFFPRPAGAIMRALNGNHEMYTGGKAYFRKALPALGQKSSYFAMRNDHWLLIALDTAHTDHDLHKSQAEWVARQVDEANGRSVILFSHHQPISLLERQGPKLVGKLSALLASRKIFAWYWGHEHRLLLYDRHPQWGLHGRCIGHGGFPYFRDEVAPVPAAPAFHRLETRNYVPGGELLLGENPYVEGHEREYGPHGFVRLEFDGPRLNEVICDAEGLVLRERELS